MAKKASPTETEANEEIDSVEGAEVIAKDVVAEQSPEDIAEEETGSDTEAQISDHDVEPQSETAEIAKSNDIGSSGSGFLPLLIGGVIAGGIGYGAAYWQNGSSAGDLNDKVAEVEQAISAVREDVSTLPAAFDSTSLESQISEVQTAIETRSSAIEETLSQLDQRVSVLERQPSGDGTLQQTAIAAYEQDIQTLRDELSAQQQDLQNMVNATSLQLEETRAEANAIEEQTVAAARSATVRSVVVRIQSALETGAPIGGELSELNEILSEPLPEALVAADQGVMTLAGLAEEFPELSRSALTAARDVGEAGEDAGGLGSFLRSQFSVRSVAPKEGDSVDAILSRAEAGLKAGRLNDALTEVESLPEVARVSLSDWIGRAEIRANAVNAAAVLFDKFNQN